MPAHRALNDIGHAFLTRLNNIDDPGSGNIIEIENIGVAAVCEITTAAAENRTLEDADVHGLGQQLYVVLVSDGGDLTILSDDDNVILSDVGEVAEFVVMADGTTNVWRLMSKSTGAGATVLTDPGSGGTISTGGSANSIVLIVTVAAENRTLPDADTLDYGDRLVVTLDTDGGDATILSDDDTVVLSVVGETAEFVVGSDGTNQVWRLMGKSVGTAYGSHTFYIPLTEFRIHDSLIALPPTTGAVDDIGFVDGTPGSSRSYLEIVTAADLNETSRTRCFATVPSHYPAGATLTVNMEVTETTAPTDTALIDLLVVRLQNTTDINPVAAQDITGASTTTISFALTSTAIVPGDVLDIRITVAVDDATTGTGTAAEHRIHTVWLSW